MATYAIGDIQGCLKPLELLLREIRFDSAADQLWFCGDLVNRGPQSLEVLRFIRGLGDRAIVVLGNHDLHLLAVAHGRKPGRRDTLAPILAAFDRDELLDWLRHRPLFHQDAALGFSMLHAGLPPDWSPAEAAACAREAEAALRGNDYPRLLDRMYGDQPDRWHPAESGFGKLRFIINCFTRLRFCKPDGRLALDAKGSPQSEPGLVPWFQMKARESKGESILFGHWSTLGQVFWPKEAVYGLDTGAVWGQKLTALRLDDRKLFSVQSAAYSEID